MRLRLLLGLAVAKLLETLLALRLIFGERAGMGGTEGPDRGLERSPRAAEAPVRRDLEHDEGGCDEDQ